MARGKSLRGATSCECNDRSVPKIARTEYRKLVNTIAALLQPGDELWRYSSSNDSWQNMCGRAGLVIVRAGQIVHEQLVVRN
jgi:hypothetical protein